MKDKPRAVLVQVKTSAHRLRSWQARRYQKLYQSLKEFSLDAYPAQLSS